MSLGLTVMLISDQWTRKFTLYLACPKHMHSRHNMILRGGRGETNILYNFLFRQNEVTKTSKANSSILSGIYLPAKFFSHHSQPKLGTQSVLNWVKLNHKTLQYSH